MSTALVVIIALGIAGALAFLVRRYETSRETKPTACSRALDEVFAHGTGDIADSLLLQRLLVHQDKCLGDAAYVDQARRLLVNTMQADRARELLEDADRRHGLTPDELKAQVAWIDLAESHTAWANDSEPRARELRDRGIAAANELRVKWPEWSLPYRLLQEAEGESWAVADSNRVNYYAMQDKLRGRLMSGPWIRAMGSTQSVVFVFVVAAVALLCLFGGVGGLVAVREMSQMKTSNIASTQNGYVELKGTLHLAPNTDSVIGPYTKTAGVWYDLETRFTSKNSKTWRERSVQPFLLRDATGEAVIEPAGMTVRTRHLASTWTGGGGTITNRRAKERLLKDGDTAYVLGQMVVTTTVAEESKRIVSVAPDGRRLFVSNYSEEQLIATEKAWWRTGVSIFLVGAIVLGWSYYQRYHFVTIPGTLL